MIISIALSVIIALSIVHNYEYGYQATLLQWSLYFKTTRGTKKLWSYIARGLEIKVI